MLSLAAIVLAAAPAERPDPCALITRADVRALVHWDVDDGRASHYHLPQAAGWRCTYTSGDGDVIVVVPDRGSPFFQNNALVDPFENGLGTRVAGVPGASVDVFDSTAYLRKGALTISIAVLASSGDTPLDTLRDLAKRAARRLP